jgi:hypothetical protein
MEVSMSVSYTIKAYGVFRTISDQFCVVVSDGVAASGVRDALAKQLGEQHKALVYESVLATDTSILADTDIPEPGSGLSILPPVCGG